MQSTKLSYARYMFYKEKGITITEENYRKLFVNQKQFEKSYGMTKEELIKKYPYNENQTINLNNQILISLMFVLIYKYQYYFYPNT